MNFSGFLHHFVLAKLATSSIRVKDSVNLSSKTIADKSNAIVFRFTLASSRLVLEAPG